MLRKRKEVLAVETLFDRMGCKTEEAGVTNQQNFSIRLVPFPCRIDFAYFETTEFNLRYLFGRLKWDHLLSINLPLYLRLVQMFYANLYTPKPEDPLFFKYEILGHRVNVNPETIRSLFKLPKGNFKYYNTHTVAQFDGFDREAALRQICKDLNFDRRGSDNEDKDSGEVDPIPILDNDSEVDVKSVEEKGLSHSGDGEERDVEQGEDLEVEKEVTKNMEDDFLVSTSPLGDGGRDQEGNDIPITPSVKGSD
ncbi:hypothetical protein Syun_001776 [Stephania yunnanensis]|uniref:Uncharacterized protein n=1 Tax=Stephania yunnanensis TaxID=152371 RepID=A0AAP0LER7_9MAGN